MGATLTRLFHWPFRNYAYFFYMVWICACGIWVILSLSFFSFFLFFFFFFFFFSTFCSFQLTFFFFLFFLLFFFFFFFVFCFFFSCDTMTWVIFGRNSSYSFIPNFLKLCRCVSHGLKMCMCFWDYPPIMFYQVFFSTFSTFFRSRLVIE